jgi:hypothetical protein
MKEEAIKRRFKLVAGELNERARQLVAASEAWRSDGEESLPSHERPVSLARPSAMGSKNYRRQQEREKDRFGDEEADARKR